MASDDMGGSRPGRDAGEEDPLGPHGDRDAPEPRHPTAAEQVGLALRAFRRAEGLSQRALADSWGVHQTLVARAERHAGELSLDLTLELLRRAGVSLAVVGPDGMPVAGWEETDLVATDRSGRRFPAHRVVRPSANGPTWWWFHDYFGRRSSGPRPRWTAEGFDIPPGTRYGRTPRPFAPGEEPRWPA